MRNADGRIGDAMFACNCDQSLNVCKYKRPELKSGRSERRIGEIGQSMGRPACHFRSGRLTLTPFD
jgi:hypothetical protein